MTAHYIAGLDLGQAQDYSALTIMEIVGAERPHTYHCRYIQRWPLGTSYPAIVTAVASTLGKLRTPVERPFLIVDASGVGRGVVDMFQLANLPAQLRAVTITGGDTVVHDGFRWRVPKHDLVSAVQVLLQTQRLGIETTMREGTLLASELRTFRVNVTKAANEVYSAREGTHDDLVLSVALAAWWGERGLQVQARLVGGDGGPMERGWQRLG